MKKNIALIFICACLYGCQEGSKEDSSGNQKTLAAQGTSCVLLSETAEPNELLPICLQEIANGHPAAERALAQAYARVKQWPQAVEWFQAAASHGDRVAQYRLGRIYWEGLGGRVDRGAAITWFLEAARGEYTPAQLRLAQIYHHGEFVESNEYLAFEWYQSCATKEPEAAFEIGVAYLSGGLGKEKNIDWGLRYLHHAAKQNYLPAKNMLEKLAAEKKPTISETSATPDLQKLGKAAQAGSSEAQFFLAQRLVEYTIPQYDKAAFYWMHRSADSGNEEAKYWLGTFYDEGIGVSVDYSKAFTLFLELAVKGHPLSQYRLGKMYCEGRGTDQDDYAGKQWIMQAAEQGVKEATVLVAQWSQEAKIIHEREDDNWENYSDNF